MIIVLMIWMFWKWIGRRQITMSLTRYICRIQRWLGHHYSTRQADTHRLHSSKDILAVFASAFRKHIPIMPFCYTAQRQTHFRIRVDAPKHSEQKYEPTAKFMIPIANLDYSTFYFAIRKIMPLICWTINIDISTSNLD